MNEFVRLLRQADFRKLLIGQSISGLGDWAATFGLIALVYDLTGNTSSVAWILILRLVPPLFAAPIGGVFADRFSRRTIMVTCDLLRAMLIALVPFVNIWLIFVIALVHELFSLFFLPARDASIPDLAPKKLLPQANGLMLASYYGSLPIAGAIFGAIYHSSSLVPSFFPLSHLVNQRPTTLVFFLDALTFLVSASLIYRLNLPRKIRQIRGASIRSDLIEGLKFVWQHRALRLLSLGIVMAMFGGGVLFAVGIAYVRETLGGSNLTFGWLASLWGAGMAMGLLLVRKLIDWRGAPYIFVASIAASGGILISMSLVSHILLAFALVIPFGMAFAISITLATSLAQSMVKDSMRGRMMGGVQTYYRLGLGAGALIMGAVAHSIKEINIGIRLDGNQLGMFVSGLLIIAAAITCLGLLVTHPFKRRTTSGAKK